MYGQRVRHAVVITASVVVFLSTTASPALAVLKLYYDPNDGSVSFDTAQTNTSQVYGYGLVINASQTPVRFITENSIQLMNTTFVTLRDDFIGENTFSSPLEGLFTIGNVLPSGLSEETWNELFGTFTVSANFGDTSQSKGRHYYLDAIGQGFPEPADLFYGPPEGEFDNRWDIVDPNTLPWAQTANLIYRAWSGEVVIDTMGEDSGYITAFLLESDNTFLPENFTPFIDSPFTETRPEVIALFADAIEPGQYSLGRILQPGMTLQEFEATFTSARFLSRAGFKGGSFDFQSDGSSMQLLYQAVPEPSTLVMLVMPLAFIMLKRKPNAS